MKIAPILLVPILLLPLLAGPPDGRGKGRGGPVRGVGGPEFDERGAMREEALLDHLDTHKWKEDPEATDKRPEDLVEYINRTYQRIVRLLHHGALRELDGQAFKETHSSIVTDGKEMRAGGELTEDQKGLIRERLDGLNDDINAALKKAEEGADRSPILNQYQHRFEEQIEFGVRSGRLSSGEASSLKRQVEKLAALEQKAKDGGLSTRERESLFELAGEISRELKESLTD